MKLPASQSPSAPTRAVRPNRVFDESGLKVALPVPDLASDFSLRLALQNRRSSRDYLTDPLSLRQSAQLLWAAQGITSPGGLRTAPSAGAIYPIRSYFLSFRVQGLPAGFYRYDVDERTLALQSKGDKSKRLAKACGDQQCVEGCAAALLMTAWYSRINREFGEVAQKLVAIEAGHIGQNWHLQAASLGLGSISVGNFDSAALKLLLPIPQDEEPLYLLLAGRI